MRDKGYADPIYSLDLLSPAAAPEEDGRYFLPAPEGRLVVRRELRRRARNYRRAVIEDAVATALAHHRSAAGSFAGHGFDAAWARHLGRWAARMAEHDGERARSDLAARLGTAEGRGQDRLARALYSRLVIASRLAGLGSRVLTGPAPRRQADLLDRLAEGARRAAEPDHAAALAACGFSAAHLLELRGLLAAAAAGRGEAVTLTEARQRSGDALSVLRGALLGDLALLCQVAPLCLPPRQAAQLRVRRLLDAVRPPEHRVTP